MDPSMLAMLANFVILGAAIALPIMFGFLDDDDDDDVAEVDTGVGEGDGEGDGTDEPVTTAMLISDLLGKFDPVGPDAPTQEPISENAEPALFNQTDYLASQQGTNGDDAIDADRTTQSAVAYFLGDGADALSATNGDDYADAGLGDDTIQGRTGDDIIYGRGGHDVIDGGFGRDVVFGGEGHDLISGANDGDALFGGAGDDSISGGAGFDAIYGGSGNDVLNGVSISSNALKADGEDSLSGGTGHDELVLGALDRAEGGADGDRFVLSETIGEDGAARIYDFNETEDQIEVRYVEQIDDITGEPIAPTIEVNKFTDETGADVLLNGIKVAEIVGGQNLTPEDLALAPVSS